MIFKIFFNWIYIHIFKRKEYLESLRVMDKLLDEKKDFCTNYDCPYNKNSKGNCELDFIMGFSPHKCPYRNTNRKFRLLV